jgi:hypothetical protein
MMRALFRVIGQPNVDGGPARVSPSRRLPTLPRFYQVQQGQYIVGTVDGSAAEIAPCRLSLVVGVELTARAMVGGNGLQPIRAELNGDR